MWNQSTRLDGWRLVPGVLGLTLALLYGCVQAGHSVVDTGTRVSATPPDAAPTTAAPVPSKYAIYAPLDVEPLPLVYSFRRDRDHLETLPDPDREVFYKRANGRPWFYQLDNSGYSGAFEPPPVEYMVLENGKAAPGWRRDEVFYMWRDVELPIEEVPAGQRERVHDPQWRPQVIQIRLSSFDVTILGVWYASVGGSDLVFPGYYDEEAGVFYAWRDAALSGDEAPQHGAFNGGLFVKLLPNTRVVSVSPPVDYIALDRERVAPGWYADRPGIFFQWRGTEMNLKDLPARARARVHDRNWPVNIVLITRKSWWS